MAERMRSSRQCIDESYLKLFPITQEDLKQKEPTTKPVVRPIDETLPTERQNKRTKQYYYDNKEKVLAQQKEYQDKKVFLKKQNLRCCTI